MVILGEVARGTPVAADALGACRPVQRVVLCLDLPGVRWEEGGEGVTAELKPLCRVF